MKQNLILIGMPASGKSTLGLVLARRLDMAFLDTDDVLAQKLGEALQDSINREGIEAFLKQEEAAILSLNVQGTVIATGGSAVYSPRAMAHLKRSGLCVFLSVPFPSIQARLSNLETRGVAIPKGQTLLDLHRERSPLYTRYADLVFREEDVWGDPSVEEHAGLLIDLLRQAQVPFWEE